MDTATAIAALTTVPARFFGLEDRVGTLSEGHLASFVITTEHLLAAQNRILETWVQGTRHVIAPSVYEDLAGNYDLSLDRRVFAMQVKGTHGDPEVLLSGFGMEDAQSLANHLTWGPDGWLYGANGSTTTGKVANPATGELVEWQGQMIWRFHGVLPTPENVLGILSLVFWALLLVVVLKYLTFILRADNNGEGGILSLLALLAPRGSVGKKASKRMVLVLLALFGTALLYGDGAITPVISVFGAVEGLKVRFPAMTHFITPLTAGILVLLFLFQKRGTERVGALFGPVRLIWFASIALIGLWWIIKYPRILWAVNPYYALHFFIQHKMHGFFALSAVVLWTKIV